MARDGSGNYSLPQASFTAGTTIESAKVNSNFSDIASALTASLAKDGQTTPTANIPMGGFKLTGLGVATGTGEAVPYQQLGQWTSTQTGAVATGTTQIPGDDTIPQNTEGDQYMSLSITPKSATSTLYIDVTWIGATNIATGCQLIVALFQDSTANALAATSIHIPATGNQQVNVKFTHKMTSGTTSATTFKVRAGCNAAGTTTFNGNSTARIMGGVMASSIVITEVYG